MSSDLCGKLEHDVEIEATPEIFLQMIAYKPYLIANATDKVHSVELLKGERGVVGSHVAWNYVKDGKVRCAKDVIEAIDLEKNSITFKVIEGYFTEHYKNLTITLQATAKSDGKGSVVHWTLEYENHHGDIDDPRDFMGYFNEILKDLGIQLDTKE